MPESLNWLDALSFNGTTDYIDIGSNPIPPSGDWTLTGWVYCEGALAGTTDDRAYAFGSVSWSGTAVQGIALRRDIIFVGDGNSHTYKVWINDITGVNVKKWYHVAMVYDSGSEQTKVYVDGAYSLTIDRAYAPSNVNFTIGRSLGLNVSKSYWRGDIESLKISDIDFVNNYITTNSKKTRKSMGSRLW